MRDPIDRGGWPDEGVEGRYGDKWQPAVDIFETADAVVVRVELPGVSAEDVRVKVEGDLVRVAGERRPSSRDVRRLQRMEIAFGPFERIVRVTTPFEREGVSAHLEDGFLEVTLPLQKPARRRVEVKGE